MGAGRRTQTVLADSSSDPRSVISRGLKKQELGGVIFVCNNETLGECLSKNLFGLPRPHLNYVLNVEEGMPLFLFNYDHRELMGTFVAASVGGYNIDPYAWSPGGKSQTRYPAQVRVKREHDCNPVPEKVFSRIIKENYYCPGKLMLELTKKQAHELLRLFTPKAPPAPPPTQRVVAKEPVAAAGSNAPPKPAEATLVPMPKPKPMALPNAWKKVVKPESSPVPSQPTPAPAIPLTLPVKKEAPAGTSAAAEAPPPVEEKKSWFEQTEEEAAEAEEQEQEKVDEEEGVTVLEQILEKLQVGESSKPELEKIVWSCSSVEKQLEAESVKVKLDKAAMESEREKLVKGIHESSIAAVVERSLRLCSEALIEMRESEATLNQTLDELRMKGECLKELDAARAKNISLVKVSISMAQEIDRLKSEVQQLKQQFVEVQ